MDQQKQRAEIISMNLNRPGVIHLIEGQEVSLGKSGQNTNPINDDRVAAFHCSIFFQDGQFVLKNLCQQGTFLNHGKLGMNMEVNLTHGDQINLLVQKGKKVPEKHVIAYMFFKYENKKPSTKKSSKCSQTVYEQIGDDLICVICTEIYYEPVTVNPCGHVFCGYCLQEWTDQSETCPICRKNIKKVTRAFQINKIVQTVLELNPEIEQNEKPFNIYYDSDDYDSDSYDSYSDSEEEGIFEIIFRNEQNRRQGINQQQFNQNAINPAPNQQRVQSPQRPNNPPNIPPNNPPNNPPQIQNNQQAVPQVNQQQQIFNAISERQERRIMCKSCVEEYKGFKCGRLQMHTLCINTCFNQLPMRNLNTYQNAELKLFCQICKFYFCKFYYGQCQDEEANKIEEISNYRPDFNINHKYINPAERTRIQQHLKQQDQRVIFDFIMNQYITKEQFYYQQNKTLFWDELKEKEINELLLPNSPVCTTCIPKVMNQMIFRYVQNHKNEEIQFRMPDCWYGINCRRQQQEVMHTRKYNHMCIQTKFD